jgi:thioredoxin 1
MFFRRKPEVEAPIIDAGDADFDREVLEHPGVTVVDFWAAWCQPCRIMAPILEEIAVEYEERGVRIVKVDTDRAPETAGRFEIRSIPTLVFFRDGEPLFQATGLVSKPALVRELDQLVGP